MELSLGLITGIVFGFLLQKAKVLRFEKQVGFLILKDMTIPPNIYTNKDKEVQLG